MSSENGYSLVCVRSGAAGINFVDKADVYAAELSEQITAFSEVADAIEGRKAFV